jgi:hypothetical protein
MDPEKVGWHAVECIHLAQDKDQNQALVNTVMNFCVSYSAVNFLSNWVLLASQEEYFFIGLVTCDFTKRKS